MGNQWFKFKQFEIQQDQCAMKVGTDGVLLGAWTNVKKVLRALDIGTGTGLIALMLAQRNSQMIIDAIEIEKSSAGQATSNVQMSKFSERIAVHEISFQEFYVAKEVPQFDLIVCNPPYFTSSYKALDSKRSMARHDDTLPLDDLFEGVTFILNPKGRFGLILPVEIFSKASELARKYSMHLIRILHVKSTPEKKEKRICVEYGFNACDPEEGTLVIEQHGRHRYSEEYIALTKDFYL